jgi:hypothetical protein
LERVEDSLDFERVEDGGDEDLEPYFEEVLAEEENELEPDFERVIEEDEGLEEKEKREVVNAMLRIYLPEFY